MSKLLLYCYAVIILSSMSFAQEIKVGVKPAPPFVVLDQESKEPVGFSVDLMNTIAKTMKPPRKIRYIFHSDMASHLKAVENGEVDMGIAATTITFEREKHLDFSHPYYRTGLSIMVLPGNKKSTWDIIFTRQSAIFLIVVVFYIIFCAHLIWLLERKGDFAENWWPGIIQGIWWAIVTMSTVGYGDFVPRRPFSKILAVVIIVTGIGLFSVGIASFSSLLTTQKLRSHINGPKDLLGRKVAVIKNTASAQEMNKMYVRTKIVNNLEQAVTALESGIVEAVVHDRPILQYYIAKNKKSNQLVLTEGFFLPANYGMYFPLDSPFRKQVNIALLKLMQEENLIFRRLEQKWFLFGGVEK